MKKYLPLGIAAVSLLIGLPAKANDSSMSGTSNTGTSNNVLLWNNAALEAIKNTSFAPPNGIACPFDPEYRHGGIHYGWEPRRAGIGEKRRPDGLG
jgi:hypothetical protein